MDDEARFYRALGIPDGLVTDDAKLQYAASRMVKPSTFVDGNEVLAARTATVCLEFVRDCYVSGGLDGFLLGEDSIEATATRVVAALGSGHLRDRLGRDGAIVQPTRGVPDSVVTACLEKLHEFIFANPIDAQ